MGIKTSLLINPTTWDALLRPCYERIGAFVRQHGIRLLMHSDHSIPFGVSYAQYRQARQRAQEIFEQSSQPPTVRLPSAEGGTEDARANWTGGPSAA